jgi:hypothetical protein
MAGYQRKGVRESAKRKAKDTATSDVEDLRKRKKRVKAHLHLQHLPLEILEQIFFACENVNLPKCSPLIGWRLSGRLTFVKLIMVALGPTWDGFWGLRREDVVSDFGWSQYRARIGGNPAFQSAVLACPQLTMDRILDAYELWNARDGRGRQDSTTSDTLGPRESWERDCE